MVSYIHKECKYFNQIIYLIVDFMFAAKSNIKFYIYYIKHEIELYT